MYKLNAGSEWYKPCVTATIAGAQNGDCTCQWCGETNGAKDLLLGQSADCRWTGVVCDSGSGGVGNMTTRTCYDSSTYGNLTLYRKGKDLIFGGLGISSQIDITGQDWEAGSFTFPFSGGDSSICDWVSPSLTIQQKNGNCVTVNCPQKELCGNCLGNLWPQSVEITFDGFDNSCGNCQCGTGNGTFLLTRIANNTCWYEYHFPVVTRCDGTTGPPSVDPNPGPVTFQTIVCYFTYRYVNGQSLPWIWAGVGSFTNGFGWGKQIGLRCNNRFWDCLYTSTGGEIWLDYYGTSGIPKTCAWRGDCTNYPGGSPTPLILNDIKVRLIP